MGGHIELAVGDRLRFAEEKRSYTVRAVSDRWVICTKPFAARQSVIYTVLDLHHQVRGVDNHVLSLGYETDDDCIHALAQFLGGTAALSSRYKPIPLRITHWRVSAAHVASRA